MTRVVRSFGVDRELASPVRRSLDGLAYMADAAGMPLRGSSSVAVTEGKLVGLPAANLALRIASTAIAELELGVYRGRDADRRVVRTTWQSRFFDGQPNGYQSWSSLLEMTEASLTGRNNAFWRLDVDAVSGRPVNAHFLPASIVAAQWGDRGAPEYRFRTPGNTWSDWTSTRVVHFRVDHVDPGAIITPSPVSIAKDVLAAMLAKPSHARATLEKNGGRQIAVSFPESVSVEQAERYRKVLEPLMTGEAAAGNVRVFGGGPDIQTIGLSFEDMQFVELMQLDAEQIGQLFGVPASLLQVMRNDRPLSPEHEDTRWQTYYLGPRRTRIETTLAAHPLFFGVGARDYPAFRARPVRADVRGQAASVTALVQAGVITPDEARAEYGLEALPDGIGAIAQITPVGGAPNPDLADPPAPAPASG